MDAHHRFLYASVGSEGRSSDSTIWKESSLCQDINDPTNPLEIPEDKALPGYPSHTSAPYFMVGDDAFKLTPRMMKPVPSPGKKVNYWADRTFNYR